MAPRVKPQRWAPGRNREGISAQLWKGCVGLWPMWGPGKTAQDLSVNRKNGTLKNGPNWVASERGRVLAFPGNDEYVDLGANDFATGSQDRTFFAWVRPRAYGSYLVHLGNTTQVATEEWRFWVGREASDDEDRQLRVEIGGSGYTSNLVVSLDEWHLIGCSLHGSTLDDHTLYLDTNTDNASGTDTLNTSSTAATLCTKLSDVTGFPLNGDMLWAALWDRDLQPAERQYLYEHPWAMIQPPDMLESYAGVLGGGEASYKPDISDSPFIGSTMIQGGIS